MVCHTGLLPACEQDQDGTSSVLILLAEIVDSNPAVGHGCLYVVIVVCCQIEVSATS